MPKISLSTFLSVKTIVTLVLLFAHVEYSLAGWEVKWIDRFDGDSVNWNNWTAQVQADYNKEIQCYTSDDSSKKKNFEVSEGTLKIIAHKQNISCSGLNGKKKKWTSGRINTKDKVEFLYGRIEARIRFNELKGGTWPAFWMLENRIAEHPLKGDNDSVKWPNSGAGEIDVWEWYSNAGHKYITNFFNANKCGSEIRYAYPNGAKDVLNFHAYAIEWTKDDIKFFMDDDLVAQQDISSCAQYKEPMFVLLNVAMGGMLGGKVDDSLSIATMEVDYVAHCVATNSNNLQQCNQKTPMLRVKP